MEPTIRSSETSAGRAPYARGPGRTLALLFALAAAISACRTGGLDGSRSAPVTDPLADRTAPPLEPREGPLLGDEPAAARPWAGDAEVGEPAAVASGPVGSAPPPPPPPAWDPRNDRVVRQGGEDVGQMPEGMPPAGPPEPKPSELAALPPVTEEPPSGPTLAPVSEPRPVPAPPSAQETAPAPSPLAGSGVLPPAGAAPTPLDPWLAGAPPESAPGAPMAPAGTGPEPLPPAGPPATASASPGPTSPTAAQPASPTPARVTPASPALPTAPAVATGPVPSPAAAPAIAGEPADPWTAGAPPREVAAAPVPAPRAPSPAASDAAGPACPPASPPASPPAQAPVRPLGASGPDDASGWIDGAPPVVVAPPPPAAAVPPVAPAPGPAAALPPAAAPALPPAGPPALPTSSGPAVEPPPPVAAAPPAPAPLVGPPPSAEPFDAGEPGASVGGDPLAPATSDAPMTFDRTPEDKTIGAHVRRLLASPGDAAVRQYPASLVPPARADVALEPGLKPVVILFYDDGSRASALEAAELLPVLERFQGRVDVVPVDVAASNQWTDAERGLVKTYYMATVPTTVVLAADRKPLLLKFQRIDGATLEARLETAVAR